MTNFVKPNVTKIATLVNNRSGWGYVLSEVRSGQTRLEDGTFGPFSEDHVITKVLGARFTNLGAAIASLQMLSKHVDEIQLSAPKPVWDKLQTKPGWRVGDSQEREHHVNGKPVRRLPTGTINRIELQAGETPLAKAWLISQYCFEREVIHGDRNDPGEQDQVLKWAVLEPRVIEMIARRVQRARVNA